MGEIMKFETKQHIYMLALCQCHGIVGWRGSQTGQIWLLYLRKWPGNRDSVTVASATRDRDFVLNR